MKFISVYILRFLVLYSVFALFGTLLYANLRFIIYQTRFFDKFAIFSYSFLILGCSLKTKYAYLLKISKKFCLHCDLSECITRNYFRKMHSLPLLQLVHCMQIRASGAALRSSSLKTPCASRSQRRSCTDFFGRLCRLASQPKLRRTLSAT